MGNPGDLLIQPFLLPFGSFAAACFGAPTSTLWSLSTPFWEFLKISVLFVHPYECLSFYSLLGVSKEREDDGLDVALLLKFYSLLGVSHAQMLRRSVPYTTTLEILLPLGSFLTALVTPGDVLT